MKRTAHRPLVTKKIVGTSGAYALAATTGMTGGVTLFFGTDPITTALGVGNIILYAGAYTFLKPRSEWNTWVGAVVGAIPPVMGYTAATHGVGIWDIEAAILGGTLFLWQFPHFFALSWMHRADYARGGFQVRERNYVVCFLQGFKMTPKSCGMRCTSVHTCDRASSVQLMRSR
jgi:protoheme IX farnesyltransferase